MSRFQDDGAGITIKPPIHFKTVNPPAFMILCRECELAMPAEEFTAGHDCEAK